MTQQGQLAAPLVLIQPTPRFDDPLKNRWSIVAVSSHGWWLTSPYQFWCHLSIISYYPTYDWFVLVLTPFLVFKSIIFEPLHTCQGLTVVLLVEERICTLQDEAPV
jgi:hypothetical protein